MVFGKGIEMVKLLGEVICMGVVDGSMWIWVGIVLMLSESNWMVYG